MFEPIKARTITCTRCGKTENERLFGEGFPTWCRIAEIGKAVVEVIPKMIDGIMKSIPVQRMQHPELCPDCMSELANWLEKK